MAFGHGPYAMLPNHFHCCSAAVYHDIVSGTYSESGYGRPLAAVTGVVPLASGVRVLFVIARRQVLRAIEKVAAAITEDVLSLPLFRDDKVLASRGRAPTRGIGPPLHRPYLSRANGLPGFLARTVPASNFRPLTSAS